MLRRKLRNNNLVFEDYLIGKQTRTKVSIAYIKGIVNEKVLQELKSRLEKIDIDSILESGYIEELIADKPLALFSTVTVTEKPDIVAGKLLEGRVAIFTDGTPHVLTVPRLLVEGFMTSEDYYLKPYYSSFKTIKGFKPICSHIFTWYSSGITALSPGYDTYCIIDIYSWGQTRGTSSSLFRNLCNGYNFRFGKGIKP